MRTRALIVLLTMAGAAPLAGCGADREEDEQQNLATLHQLPPFPGARQLEVSTAAYYGDEEGPFDGAERHTTRITYRAPAGTTQRKLVRFYMSRLRQGWQCRVERSPRIDITAPERPRGRGVALQLGCSNDTASISVNPDNLGSKPPKFEVAADHRGGTR